MDSTKPTAVDNTLPVIDDVNDINDEAKTQLTDNKEEGEE